MNIFEKWFCEYTQHALNVVAPDVKATVQMKITHTYKVRDHCVMIAKDLMLSPREVLLADILGLYHDLGRFKQAMDFGTINDKITGSHADMSAAVFLNDAPHDDLNETEVQIIHDALKYHNLLELPPVDLETLFFSRLIRDADKLDILDLFSDWETNKKFLYLADDESDYSPEIVDLVLQGKNFNSGLIKSQNDIKLLYLSMIYDLNFSASKQWIINNNILERFTNIKNNPDDVMVRVYAAIHDYLVLRISTTSLLKSLPDRH